jgi:glutathione S-transferase
MMLTMDMGIIRPAAGPASGYFKGPDMKKVLRDLTRELKEGPKGGFFMGEEPGRADILFEYPISMVKHRNWVDLKEFPDIDAWLQRVYNRDAWKRGLEKGNGYDLGAFAKAPKL